jgi:hypothetical protein
MKHAPSSKYVIATLSVGKGRYGHVLVLLVSWGAVQSRIRRWDDALQELKGPQTVDSPLLLREADPDDPRIGRLEAELQRLEEERQRARTAAAEKRKVLG